MTAFVVTGFVSIAKAPVAIRKTHSIKAISPGEIDSTPSTIVSNSVKKLQKFAMPIAALASLLLPVFAQQAMAAETAAAPVVEEKPVLGPAPTDFGLNYKDFFADASKVRHP